jgi:hypothetical protein
VPTYPHILLEPACALEQHHTLLCEEICDGAIQLLVGEKVVKGMLALGAPLLAQSPLQYTVHCKDRPQGTLFSASRAGARARL